MPESGPGSVRLAASGPPASTGLLCGLARLPTRCSGRLPPRLRPLPCGALLPGLPHRRVLRLQLGPGPPSPPSLPPACSAPASRVPPRGRVLRPAGPVWLPRLRAAFALSNSPPSRPSAWPAPVEPPTRVACSASARLVGCRPTFWPTPRRLPPAAPACADCLVASLRAPAFARPAPGRLPVASTGSGSAAPAAAGWPAPARCLGRPLRPHILLPAERKKKEGPAAPVAD
nr:WAS/WASL-interacting protein family member 3-like [Aegilops tauschii subsp. strangulata]